MVDFVVYIPEVTALNGLMVLAHHRPIWVL